MGCGGSKDSKGNSPIVQGTQEGKVYDRRPKISVRMGGDVRKREDSPTVIFIFGGPGSRKGRIVDDLINSYGCKFICSEQLIMTELPRKVANVMKLETIKDIKDLLEEDSSHMSMEWILNLVERYIERDNDPDATYIVDYLPNLKYLLRIPFITGDCKDAMNKFEEHYPVSFALNMAVPADKIPKRAYWGPPKKGTGEGMKETGGQGDEADMVRTQRRAELYQQSVKSFIDYFTKTDRLATVDVTSGSADLIWNQVHHTMCLLHFHPSRTVNTVVLFVFEDNDISDIDVSMLSMKLLELRTLTENPQGTTEELISSLCVYIDNQSKETEAFVVNLTGTSLSVNNNKKLSNKPITFVELEENHLERYLSGTPRNYVPRSNSPKFKAVCSLENEMCLFPITTSSEVCSSIANQMAVKRFIK